MVFNAAQSSPSTTSGWCLDAAGLAEVLRDEESIVRRSQARQGRIIAQIESQTASALYGYSSTSGFLQDLLHVSRKEANARVSRARTVNPIHEGSNVIEPIAPLAGVVFAEGSIGVEHVDAIAGALTELPATVTSEDRNSAEKILVDLARDAGPRSVTRAGKEIVARLDPDGSLPEEKELAQPHRDLQLHQRRDGYLVFKGMLDPETSASFRALLSPLAKPRPANESGPDFRDIGERQGDAFAEIVQLALGSKHLPAEAGERPHVVVTLDFDTLRRELGQASLGQTSGGTHLCPGSLSDTSQSQAHLDLVGQITASQARRLACDANIIPVVLGSRGEPLDVGRKHRLVTPAQRRALNLRDKGCAFPGCERPPQHCEAHHAVHWSQGGPTDLNNLVLLCGHHHRLLHHSEWEVHIRHNGLPEFIPPTWLDPAQKPRHNRILRT